MKTLFVVLMLTFFFSFSFSQALQIECQHRFGGSGGEEGAQARGILEFLKPDFYFFVDCISLPDTTHVKSKSIAIDRGENEADELLMVSVKPNPATQYIEIS